MAKSPRDIDAELKALKDRAKALKAKKTAQLGDLVQLAGRAEAVLWFGAETWRWIFWMGAVPSTAYLLGVLLIPESPCFLVISGRKKQARQIFALSGAQLLINLFYLSVIPE